jgi:2-phosphosulfolactate phosphatase
MINCEWGLKGIEKYSALSDVTIIVDVFSFSTCVDAALANKAVIYPYMYKDDSVTGYAAKHHAVIAGNKRSKEKPSLSPVSLKNIKPGTGLILPSPNGSALSLASGSKITLCACLRNYNSVAAYANSISRNILIVPAGEKWPDDSIRFAIEDYAGAGAVISCLTGELSAESTSAAVFYHSLKPHLKNVLSACDSARELMEKGFPEDVEFALELGVSTVIPVLKGNYYKNIGIDS